MAGRVDRETRLEELVESGAFNEVSAHRLPDGGIEIMLSASISLDDAVSLRVRDDRGDIAFLYDDPDQEERLKRTNHGGPWD